MFTRVKTFLGLVVLWAAPVLAQQPPAAPPEPPGAEFTTRICGQDVPAPSSLPPAGSGPVVYYIARDKSLGLGPSPINPIAIGIAFRKHDTLKTPTQRAITRLYANGTMRRIVAKWGMSKAVTLLK